MVLTAANRLAATVADLLRDGGLYHDDGTLKGREAERRTGIARNTLRRRLASGMFNPDELERIGAAFGLSTEQIVARANERVA